MTTNIYIVYSPIMTAEKKGILIIFEGIDGAGKSTQAQMLYEALARKGYPALITKEPTAGPYGQKIREIARKGREGITAEEEHQLFLEDRREHVKNLLAPALADGKIVISDRYYFSNIAYQGALGLSPEKIREDNEKIAPRPDLIFLLEIQPPQGINRIRVSRPEANNLGYEQEAYLVRVKKIFDHMEDPSLVRLDARRDMETLHQEILGVLAERLGI